MQSTKDPNSIDDLVLQIKGKIEIPSKLEIGHNYTLSCKGSITAITETDREDGGRVYLYKFEPTFVELITETGKTLKTKDPRKNSVKIRNYLFKIYVAEGYTEPFDDVYDAFCWEVMGATPILIKEAVKRINGEKTNP